MINAPLIAIKELDGAESLAKYGNVGYRTERYRRLIMVKLIGYVIDVIDNDERRFTFIRLDDGTGTILVKIFGEKEKREKFFGDLEKWDFVLVLGFIRHWGEEIYIQPITIKKLDFVSEVYYKYRLYNEYYKKFYEESYSST